MQSILFLGAKLLSTINVVCLTVTHSHCQERFFCLKVVLVNDRIIVVLSGKLSFFFYIRIAMRLFIVHLIFNIFSCLSDFSITILWTVCPCFFIFLWTLLYYRQWEHHIQSILLQHQEHSDQHTVCPRSSDLFYKHTVLPRSGDLFVSILFV